MSLRKNRYLADSDNESQESSLGAKEIISICLGVFVVLSIISYLIYYFWRKKRVSQQEKYGPKKDQIHAMNNNKIQSQEIDIEKKNKSLTNNVSGLSNNVTQNIDQNGNLQDENEEDQDVLNNQNQNIQEDHIIQDNRVRQTTINKMKNSENIEEDTGENINIRQINENNIPQHLQKTHLQSKQFNSIYNSIPTPQNNNNVNDTMKNNFDKNDIDEEFSQLQQKVQQQEVYHQNNKNILQSEQQENQYTSNNENENNSKKYKYILNNTEDQENNNTQQVKQLLKQQKEKDQQQQQQQQEKEEEEENKNNNQNSIQEEQQQFIQEQQIAINQIQNNIQNMEELDIFQLIEPVETKKNQENVKQDKQNQKQEKMKKIQKNYVQDIKELKRKFNLKFAYQLLQDVEQEFIQESIKLTYEISKIHIQNLSKQQYNNNILNNQQQQQQTTGQSQSNSIEGLSENGSLNSTFVENQRKKELQQTEIFRVKKSILHIVIDKILGNKKYLKEQLYFLNQYLLLCENDEEYFQVISQRAELFQNMHKQQQSKYNKSYKYLIYARQDYIYLKNKCIIMSSMQSKLQKYIKQIQKIDNRISNKK